MAELSQHRCASQQSEAWIRCIAWVEKLIMQILLTLTLWPLRLIYRRPKPDESWPAWQANQRLCRADQRYC